MVKLFNNKEILDALSRIERLLTIIAEDVEFGKEMRERQLLKVKSDKFKKTTTMIRK